MGGTLRSVMFLVRDYLGMERVACLPEAKLSEEGTSRDSLLVKEAATERDTKISFTHWKPAYVVALSSCASYQAEKRKWSRLRQQGGLTTKQPAEQSDVGRVRLPQLQRSAKTDISSQTGHSLSEVNALERYPPTSPKLTCVSQEKASIWLLATKRTQTGTDRANHTNGFCPFSLT